MKSGQIVVGIVLVSVAAALAAYVTDFFGTSVADSQHDREWAADHAAMVELAERVQLPDGYAETDCSGEEDSRCWHATLAADRVVSEVRAALTAADLADVSESCRPVLGVESGSCTLSAPFGHERQVSVLVSVATGRLTADDLDDPAAIAAAGVDVRFVVPAL